MQMFLYVSMFLFIATGLNAQCSDAGVCNLGLAGGDTVFQKHNEISLEYAYARSGNVEKINYHTLKVGGRFQLIEGGYLLIFAPLFRLQDGPLGSVNGFGDLIVAWEQLLWHENDKRFSLQLGSKLATGDSRADAALPMSYQTGLGTNDILFGVNFNTSSWLISAGYQYAEKVFNDNTTPLKRGDDVYIKGAYSLPLQSFRVSAEVLAIKRLGKSIIRTAGVESRIDKSDPLQVNVGFVANYPVGEYSSVFLKSAFALLEREVNTDGLTRALSLAIGGSIKF